LPTLKTCQVLSRTDIKYEERKEEMKATITIKDVDTGLLVPTALVALGAAVKKGLLRVFAVKPVDEKVVAQVLNTPGRGDHYWQQITIGSSRL
jgi:hypothetical protein